MTFSYNGIFSAFKLSADRRPKTIYEFYVTSHRCYFPVDMLRYDACWPARQEDVSLIEHGDDKRSIKLCSYSKPTVDRWSSFGWTVTATSSEA